MTKQNDLTAEFQEHYKQLQGVTSGLVAFDDYDSKPVTLSAQDMPLINFVRVLAGMSELSIVVDQKLDDKNVTLDINNQPVHEVLSMLARRLDVDVSRSGNMYYLGDIKPEDRGVYVRKVRRVSFDDLNSVLAILRSDSGRGAVLTGGIVVIGDRVELLRRVDDMFNQIENAPANSWCLQLFVVSVSESYLSNIGVDTSFSMDMTYNIAKASHAVDSSLAMNGVLSSFLQADKTDSRIETVTRPTFFLQDGIGSSFHSGQKYKVALKTVSDSGTVTTTGYQDIDTGLQIDVKLIECKESLVQLNLSIEKSEIISYTDNVPNVTSDEFTVTSVLESGRVYLLGSFDSSSMDDTTNGIFSLHKSDNDNSRQFLVWSRVFKVL